MRGYGNGPLNVSVLPCEAQIQAAWRGRRVRKAVEEGDFEFLGIPHSLASWHPRGFVAQIRARMLLLRQRRTRRFSAR